MAKRNQQSVILDRKLQLDEASQQLRAEKDLAKARLRATTARDKAKFSIITPEIAIIPNPEVMSNQWYYNGFVISLEGKVAIVDPGPGFLFRFNRSGLDLGTVGAVILSHWHTDHAYDLAFCLEKLFKFNQLKLDLYLPFRGYSEELPAYFQQLIAKKVFSGQWKLSLIDEIKTAAEPNYLVMGRYPLEFAPLKHNTPTFGFKLHLSESVKLGYISDTGYTQSIRINDKTYTADSVPRKPLKQSPEMLTKEVRIKDFYAECDVLVTNINDISYNRHSRYHLSGWDLADILEGSKCKTLIIQHLSPFLDQIYLQAYAEFLSNAGLAAKNIHLPQVQLQKIEL